MPNRSAAVPTAQLAALVATGERWLRRIAKGRVPASLRTATARYERAVQIAEMRAELDRREAARDTARLEANR